MLDAADRALLRRARADDRRRALGELVERLLPPALLHLRPRRACYGLFAAPRPPEGLTPRFRGAGAVARGYSRRATEALTPRFQGGIYRGKH